MTSASPDNADCDRQMTQVMETGLRSA